MKIKSRGFTGLYTRPYYKSKSDVAAPCRTWLSQVRPSTALKRIGGGSEAVLHSAILQTSLTRQQGGFYIQTITESSNLNTFRMVC